MHRITALLLFSALCLAAAGQSADDGREPIELPEFVYESQRLKALHILAYVREYSTISTLTDTVTMFREKMVDYMIAPRKKSRFKGWSVPRVLSSRSYYRFTDSRGLDSVSNRFNQHFSWSDWIGIPPAIDLPPRLLADTASADTLMGKYSPVEVWRATNDSLAIRVDALADSGGRRWVPELGDLGMFDRLNLEYRYLNTSEPMLNPASLDVFSYSVESRGRGRGVYLFGRADGSYWVSTGAEVYILDREYVTLKEARKWEKLRLDDDSLGIVEPAWAPPLPPDVQELVDRVSAIDHDMARLSLAPDRRLAGNGVSRLNPGQQILKRLKGILGIDRIAGKRKREKQWREFRNEQRDRRR